VGRTQVPSFKIMLSSLFDGLEVLNPLQSCNSRRANRHRDAFTRLRHSCHSMNCPAVEEHVPVFFALRGENTATVAYVGECRSVGRNYTVRQWLKGAWVIDAVKRSWGPTVSTSHPTLV
jgi:hypothetical protein